MPYPVIPAGRWSRGLEPEPSRREAAGADAVLPVQGHQRAGSLSRGAGWV